MDTLDAPTWLLIIELDEVPAASASPMMAATLTCSQLGLDKLVPF
jgi:hypothetical protein